MRRFASVLVVLAACGDNVVGPDPLPTEPIVPDNTVTAEPTTTARYEPAVCAVAQWTGPAGREAKLALTVAPSRAHTSVLAVPTAGGSLSGFVVDERMTMQTNPAQAKIPIDGTFSAVSAVEVNGRVVAAAVDGAAVKIHLFGDALANPQELAKLPGTTLGTPAFMSADYQPVIVLGGADGVAMTRFDANYQIGETKLVAPSKPVTSLGTTQFGEAILAAWTTDAHECYMADLAGFAAGRVSHANKSCDRPRLAVDLAGDTANVVFESSGDVRIMHAAHMQLGGASTLIRSNAHAPRIVFDGHRYWVSYIDPRGQIVVGFLDRRGQLTSMALAGLAPADDAFELAVLDDGLPWVFSYDLTSGYMAHAMCAVAE